MDDHRTAIEEIRAELRELHAWRDHARRGVALAHEFLNPMSYAALCVELAHEEVASDDLRTQCVRVAADLNRLRDLAIAFLQTRPDLDTFQAARIDALRARLRPPNMLERVAQWVGGLRQR